MKGKFYNNRGAVKYKLKDYKGSLSDFNSAIKLDPNNAMAFCNRGLAKIKLNDKNGGCLDLSKAGELGFQVAYESIKKYCN